MTDRIIAGTSRIALGSIGVGVVVLALKVVAWWMTGSVALYSDALESTVNIATAIAAWAAISYSARPADANHPFGHHKAEYFSVVLDGVMIVIAALLIFQAAWDGYRNPRMLDEPGLGIAINLAAGVLNAAWAFVLIRYGRARGSPALAADGMHLLTDVVTSAGVAVGLVLAVVTGWAVLDPLLAAAVAANILWQGWRLIRESIGGLMDEAPAVETVDHIKQVISESAEGALEAHDVRTRQAGRRTFIEFHLVVPGNMPVSEAHEICDRIEAALRKAVDDTHITIHVEPEGKAKSTGVVVL